MAFKKTRISVWPDGHFTRVELGPFDTREDAEQDMTLTRENHGGRASTLSIEETASTLVVVKEDGVVFVYNWAE